MEIYPQYLQYTVEMHVETWSHPNTALKRWIEQEQNRGMLIISAYMYI